ncbi:MAG: hypothetical protein E7588_04005 [Ruminococcaceae bacterium]|nr:hypothetical protein [Oscillospiraceae bacterium]
MLTRILTAAAGLAVFLPVMCFSGTYAFNAALAVVCVIAVYELLGVWGMKKEFAVCLPAYIYAVALPLYTAVSYKYIYNISMLMIFLMMLVSVMAKGKYDVGKLTAFSAFCVYAVSSFTSLLLIRRMEQGAFVIWLVFIGAWVTDTAAYFCGRFLGKHKLIPDVSPKKTVEGAVGGVVFCTLSFLLYGFLIKSFSDTEVNFVFLAVSGVVLSIVSQAGDLVMSKLKRAYGVKDFGNLLPGHGGILDRFDSILAVALLLMIISSRPDMFYFFR